MKKNFKFDYDLTALSTYTREVADEILLKEVLGLTLPRYASVRANIRGTEKVPFMTNDLVFQDGKSCGFNATGSTSIDQVLIETTTEKINMELCPYELYDYFLTERLRQSNFQEEVPFETQLVQDIANRMGNRMELQLFQSTKLGGGDFDGVDALLVTGNGATQITYSAASVDSIATLIENIPSNVIHRSDLAVMVNYADYRAYVNSLRSNSTLNLFNFDDAGAMDGQEFVVYAPGTRIPVIPSVGVPANTMYAGPASYFQVGMNTTDDNGMSIKAFYDEGVDTVKIIGRMTYGLGIFDIASFVVAR